MSFLLKKFKEIRHKKIIIISIVFTFLLTLSGCGGGGSSSSGSSPYGGGGSSSSSGGSSPYAAGIVTLSWDAPTTNSDGTPIKEIGGYSIYYGQYSNNYTNSINAGNSIGASISDLSPGTWCFSVTAYDSSGNQSDYSTEICTTV